MNTDNILIIKENPYYKRKKPLNKNQKILKALNISTRQLSEYLWRNTLIVQRDFKNMENMQKPSRNRKIKRGWLYARAVADISGQNLDENIFL